MNYKRFISWRTYHVNLVARAWCVGRSLGLGHNCGFRSCLVRVVCFIKMLCHNMDSPNGPRGAPHHEFFCWIALTQLELPHAISFWVQVGWVNNHRHETHFCSLKKKNHVNLAGSKFSQII